MTDKQKRYKASLIRSIHCSAMYKNVYAPDRDLYEAMLSNRFNVKSSKDMSIQELLQLDSFMNKKDGLRLAPKKVYASQNQTNYIITVWRKNSRDKSLESLLKLATKILKKPISDLSKITKKEGSSLIAVVNNIKPLSVANNTDYKT